MKIRLLLTILLLTATIAANTQIMERTFLKKVLTKLEKIESATYYVTDESRQPDDSTTLFSSKEFELYRNRILEPPSIFYSKLRKPEEVE